MRVGLQAGMHWNKVDFSPSVDQETYLGQSVSLVFVYVSQPHLGVQAEFSFDKRGWRENAPDRTDHYERQINYFTFTPLTLVALGRGAVQPLILAGPYLSVPLSSVETIPADWPAAARYGDGFSQRLGYGITAGLGGQAHLGRVSIQAEGRYRLGFSSIFPLGAGDVNFSEPNAWEARLAVFFRIN